MTDDELAAIRQRAEAATLLSPLDDQREYVIRGDWHNDRTADVLVPAADADFIAHARQDIPALLAEVERLREERH